MQSLNRLFSSRVFKFLFNDYIKIAYIAFISIWLYYILNAKIELITLNKPFRGITLKLIYTIPHVIFFVILGIFFALILQNKLLLKSFLAGSILTLLILSRFPYFRFYLGLNIFEINHYFALFAFPLGAEIVVMTGLNKRISIFARNVLTIVLGLIFIAGLGQLIFSVYNFRTSTSYKNSIGFEIPVYPDSFDIQSKTQSSTGLKKIGFKKEGAYLSYDMINYYNEFLQKCGFAIEIDFLAPLWFKNENLGPDYYLGRRYINKQSQLFVTISLHQAEVKSKNIQNINIQVCPNLEKYERIFSESRKTIIDKSTIESLILANFQFYAVKPLDLFSPVAQEWLIKNFPNKDPSVLIRDFDENGLSDVAVLACPAPWEKRADIFAIFSQEIRGCFRKLYSKETSDDSFILPVAKGTMLNFGEGTYTSKPNIPMAHDAIALSSATERPLSIYWQPALKTFGSIPIESDRIIEFIKKRG